MNRVIVPILVIYCFTQAAAQNQNCWKAAYGRGAGKPVSFCPTGEKYFNVCYPNCALGYKGVGQICWQTCPAGFIDTGVQCLKPSSYGRGGGYMTNSWCFQGTGKICEKWGMLFYPSCLPSFKAMGCCVCSPACPAGFQDLGFACSKPSYNRGNLTPAKCQPYEEENGPLCYSPCQANHGGNGPVCWRNCPLGMFDCGALCTIDQSTCTAEAKTIGQNVYGQASAIVKSALGVFEVLGIVRGVGPTAVTLSKQVCI